MMKGEEKKYPRSESAIYKMFECEIKRAATSEALNEVEIIQTLQEGLNSNQKDGASEKNRDDEKGSNYFLPLS